MAQYDIARRLYTGETTTGLSRDLWKSCPILGCMTGQEGIWFHDDFVNVSDHVTDQSVQRYDSYIDNSTTISQLAGVVNGVVQVANNSTDNDEGNLSCHGPMVQVSDTSGDDFPLWFETRIKVEAITDDYTALFVGLAFDHGSSVPLAIADAQVDNSGLVGAFSFLGFSVDHVNGGTAGANALVNFIYRAEGEQIQTTKSAVHTFVADTYVKLGFRYQPGAIDDKKIAIFVDNTEQSTYVTAANIAADTFPDAEPLTPTLLTKSGSANENKVSMDWWACAQLR